MNPKVTIYQINPKELIYQLLLMNINNAKAIEIQNLQEGKLQRGLVKQAIFIPDGIRIELDVLATNPGSPDQPKKWSKETAEFHTYYDLPFNQEEEFSHYPGESPFITIVYPVDGTNKKNLILLYHKKISLLKINFAFLS